MTVSVSADEIYRYFTQDCDREYLGYEGVAAIVRYFEELEEDMGSPIEFDISFLWSWDKADSWIELAKEFDKDITEECTEEDARQFFVERGCCLDCNGFVLFSECH